MGRRCSSVTIGSPGGPDRRRRRRRTSDGVGVAGRRSCGHGRRRGDTLRSTGTGRRISRPVPTLRCSGDRSGRRSDSVRPGDPGRDARAVRAPGGPERSPGVRSVRGGRVGESTSSERGGSVDRRDHLRRVRDGGRQAGGHARTGSVGRGGPRGRARGQAAMSRPYDREAHRRASRAIRGLPCHWCGRPSTELDHVIALADGGAAFAPGNVVPSCRSCNATRGLEVARRRRRGIGSSSRSW
jgi:hypothetical protein